MYKTNFITKVKERPIMPTNQHQYLFQNFFLLSRKERKIAKKSSASFDHDFHLKNNVPRKKLFISLKGELSLSKISSYTSNNFCFQLCTEALNLLPY